MPSALRVGLIGLDTSHCPVFTDAFNNAAGDSALAGIRVVAALPAGNPEFPLSRDRIAGFTQKVREKGVEIVGSMDALLERVDVAMVLSVDGGQHLAQAEAVLRAGKRLFIDKPLAATLRDAVKIVDLGDRAGVSWFTTSSLRYMPGVQRLRALPELGKIVGCEAFGPTRAMQGHGDLCWYGIHGIEILYTLMGTGCQRVTRVKTPTVELVTGVWRDGRVGTFRGIHDNAGHAAFGATAFGTNAIAHESCQADYMPMLGEIAKFFRTGVPPVEARVSLELMAYIEAAELSGQRGGAVVTIDEVVAAARG